MSIGPWQCQERLVINDLRQNQPAKSSIPYFRAVIAGKNPSRTFHTASMSSFSPAKMICRHFLSFRALRYRVTFIQRMTCWPLSSSVCRVTRYTSTGWLIQYSRWRSPSRRRPRFHRLCGCAGRKRSWPLIFHPEHSAAISALELDVDALPAGFASDSCRLLHLHQRRTALPNDVTSRKRASVSDSYLCRSAADGRPGHSTGDFDIGYFSTLRSAPKLM